MCYDMMDHPFGSEWNIALQNCGANIQRVARSLDPFVGDEEARKKAMQG
jgi:hypothetical protein